MNNIVSYTETFVKRVDLKLSVLTEPPPPHTKRARRKLPEVMDMFITLIVVMGSQSYAHV